MTKNQKNEVQLFRCRKDPTAAAVPGKSKFTLTFRGHTTRPMSFAANVAEMRDKLLVRRPKHCIHRTHEAMQELPSISAVTVTYSDAALNKVCKPGVVDASNNVVKIEFLQEFGE